MGSLRIMAAIDAIHDISHSKAFFLLGLCAVVIFVVRWYKASLKGTLPPGPRGFPIVGNTFQLGRLPWFQLTRWARQYGPIYSLNLGGQILIVLNNHKVASDLLDKRSAIYADRPRMIMTGELLCGGFFFAFNSCNDLWRRLRKAAFEGLNFRSSEVFQPVQEREAIRLAEALVKNPSAWMDHINRVTASGVLSVCYSLPPVASAEDPVITLINNFMHRIEAGSRPGEYLVELFPWMLRLPKWMAKWHRDADEAHARDTEMFMKFHLDAKRRAALGQCGPCMSGILMERNEVFRWRNIGPLGLPHYSTEDDWYEGYYIPKGSMIFFNQWAMNTDTEVYGDDFNTFRPERFLDETGKKENVPPNTHGEGHTGFGYGRRKCVGVNLAKSTMFINIATTLWAFDIGRGKDSNGNVFTPDPDAFEDRGLVVGPDPFPVTFTPRYPDVVPEILAHAQQVVRPVQVQHTPIAPKDMPVDAEAY
ncbi:unnamed protein product [Somion occarium]|uniref:Cytochrome P450 n=1 Tax=Somion occarium TaxID=3059160 RepID=A0ABP1CW61_9APHY